LAEEGAAGWQLARQLDSNRLILRRPVAARADDALLGEHYKPVSRILRARPPGADRVVLAVLVLGLLGALMSR
jgi:hypothetical protein